MYEFKRKEGLASGEHVIGGPEGSELPKYLAYALTSNAPQHCLIEFDDLHLQDVSLIAEESFLDFEGVVTFAGTFEEVREVHNVLRETKRSVVCRAPDELDRRERQFVTGLQQELTFIFLVPGISVTINLHSISPRVDLFRRILAQNGISWISLPNPLAHVDSFEPEFRAFINQYGTAYVQYGLHDSNSKNLKPLCGIGDNVHGFSLGNRVFFLPCAYPQSHNQAIEVALTAIRAVRAYRERISESMPEWVEEYRFEKESGLVAECENLQDQLTAIESEIDVFKRYKGALCFRSDPLVGAVAEILNDFFDIELDVDEKFIEDAVLKDEQDETLAVFEIKGVNNCFRRANVNQVDSHRERLELPDTTPGILIMNTKMSASSLADKDQPPHSDIIKKAADTKVLMIRTLDLLRCADLCQTGKLSKETFLENLLSGGGWLKAEGDKIEIVKG